jgi:hypothetical protein
MIMVDLSLPEEEAEGEREEADQELDHLEIWESTE